MRPYELVSNTNMNLQNSLRIILAIEFSNKSRIPPRLKHLQNLNSFIGHPFVDMQKIGTICIYLDVYKGILSIYYEM